MAVFEARAVALLNIISDGAVGEGVTGRGCGWTGRRPIGTRKRAS